MRILALIITFFSSLAFSQTETSDSDPTVTEQTIIDSSPFTSARATAMGGAISTVADDLDATFANPAGIGGLGMGKRKMPWVRKLYFPAISGSANSNAKSLNKAFKEQGGAEDTDIGQSILDAAEGKRQYGRANVVAGTVLGRSIYVPFTDYQVATVSQGNGLVDTHYRAMSGFGMGFSVQDPKGIFSLGYFGYTATVKDLKGILSYQEMIDTESRKEAFSNYTNSYSGAGHNVGFAWVLAKRGKPTLSFVAKDIQDTHLASTGDIKDVASPSVVTSDDETETEETLAESTTASSEFEIEDEIVYRRNTTIGFSVSPQIGKSSHINWVLEATHLDEKDKALHKKMRTGLEYNIWGATGSYAGVSLRAGYNSAGGSAGAYLNLGIINFEASSYAVDIGVDNKKVIERRMTGTVGINVGEF
jgi:hypothetical protein